MLKELEQKVISGKVSLREALLTAYAGGVKDMEDLCVDKSKTMSNKQRVYYKATGTNMIHTCASDLLSRKGATHV